MISEIVLPVLNWFMAKLNRLAAVALDLTVGYLYIVLIGLRHYGEIIGLSDGNGLDRRWLSKS